MSWSETKKINSDMKTPVNHLIWLMDYKAYGEDSYVFRNKDILYELYRDYPISLNDGKTATETIEFVLEENKEVGKAVGSIYGMQDSIDWNSIRTLDDFANNQDAASVVWDNQFLMEAIKNVDESVLVGGLSETSIQKIVVSQGKMDIVCTSVPMLSKIYDLSLDNSSILNTFQSSSFLSSAIKKNTSRRTTGMFEFSLYSGRPQMTHNIHSGKTFIVSIGSAVEYNLQNPYFVIPTLSGQLRINANNTWSGNYSNQVNAEKYNINRFGNGLSATLYLNDTVAIVYYVKAVIIPLS